MDKVMVRQEKVIIPTYEIQEYDKNPMFLEKRVYQGSSGRVYPHPVCEGVADGRTDREYNAIFLENEYILVMLLPELGGRVQRLYDKTNGYDAVYYNEVVKPALVGLAGPWISGGIEFNWPQHHRPSTFDPVDYCVRENEDGSVTVWMGETEKMFHTKGMAGFTVYPHRAYLEIRGQVYNPTDRPQTFLWWANPAVPVNDHTRSVFPPDVHAVMDHGKRDVSKFPIADGIYYKYDYAPGTDISRYKNIPVPTSYMAYHSDYDFVGNYDEARQAGLLHVADHHVSPGKKQWTWGCGDFGKAWDRNLTDENGPYIELMTGMFTDNQPDFTYLKPYEEKTFVQYFMPYKGVGMVKNASAEMAAGLECGNGSARFTVYSPLELKDVVAELSCEGKVFYSEKADISPVSLLQRTVPVPDREAEGCSVPDGNFQGEKAAREITLRISRGGREILSYVHSSEKEAGYDVPEPAEALPAPEELETTEKLFLAAAHLEQYRHATRSPEPYYLEGLKRDGEDIRLNNGYGKYLYNKGLFAESEKYFRTAVGASTWKNPNPYDCEPYYNLGLSLKMQGRLEEAYDAFYKAAWDGHQQEGAFYQLACVAAAKGSLGAALEFVEKSLVKGLHNLKARTLKSALLRLTGRLEEAEAFAEATLEIDRLDHGAYYERYRLAEGCDREERLAQMRAVMREDNHNYIELALSYSAAGLDGEAAAVLRFMPRQNEPMAHYYLYCFTGDGEELAKAEEADSSYCFPNRLEDMRILAYAAENGGQHAAYYLGCLLYDRGRWQEARKLWEKCAENISLATVHRNLSLVYYNKLHDGVRALEEMETAFAMDEKDARVFFELDQLKKALNVPVEERLVCMEAYRGMLERRDDLYTEYITLLNLTGKYEQAYRCISGHRFHPWEGGEGKIPAQYRNALIHMAQKAADGDREKAIGYLEQALVYPHNLGEGKLIGNTDSDIYYLLGGLYSSPEKAQEAYRLAARGTFDLSSAMYYNDQPPEMMYYAAKALEALGETEEARRRFDAFIEYAGKHMEDKIEIDYFAVSLPDFLIFEGNLGRNNRVHCCLMAALGYLGLGDREKAVQYAERGMGENCSHISLRSVLEM